MRVEIVAIGTELLLGDVVDTNSSLIAKRISAVGLDCYYQTRVGDNVSRIAEVLRNALSRSDAVITCGGLGPTADDVTREALALVMGVDLVRDPELVQVIEAMFTRRGQKMPVVNACQADVPVGALVIDQVIGTAPGLICPVGTQVICSAPGVPAELEEMLDRAIVPHLCHRFGTKAVIASRTLRTWGLGESSLAELIAPRVEALDAGLKDVEAGNSTGMATIAFLANAIEGVKVRVTVKSPDAASAAAVLDDEERALRELLGEYVFGVDDETMEFAVGSKLIDKGLTLAVAESLTGGLISARLVSVPGASRWLSGGVVTYASESKYKLLNVEIGPVVTAEAARAMAEGVRTLFGADVGLSTTGVAGPDSTEGLDPGTVFVGLAIAGEATEAVALSSNWDRERVRQYGAMSAMNLLRRRLSKGLATEQ